jgi:hypothetical protein
MPVVKLSAHDLNLAANSTYGGACNVAMLHSVSAGVLKSRTRLLITNQLQYLPQCDHICFMLKVCLHQAC